MEKNHQRSHVASLLEKVLRKRPACELLQEEIQSRLLFGQPTNIRFDSLIMVFFARINVLVTDERVTLKVI